MLANAKCSIAPLRNALFAALICIPLHAAQAEKVHTTLPWTGEAKSGKQTPAEVLYEVEDFLNNMKSMVADFRQVSPDGTLASGKMYMKKPGRMRWEYKPPTPVLMVADGETLVYYDYELDQISYLPMEDTFATFLIRPNIRFRDDALRVINFKEGANSIRFTVLQAERPNDGSITLELTRNPMKIDTITMVDATGQRTHITLKNQATDLRLGNELFIFDHPRKSRKRNYRR